MAFKKWFTTITEGLSGLSASLYFKLELIHRVKTPYVVSLLRI